MVTIAPPARPLDAPRAEPGEQVQQPMQSPTQPEVARYVIVNARTGAPVPARLGLVRATGQRLLRLLGRRSLRNGEGVRHILDEPMSLRGRAAVDIAFLDRDGTLVHAIHSLAPSEPGRAHEVHTVIELPAGALGRLEARTGDVIAMYRGESG